MHSSREIRHQMPHWRPLHNSRTRGQNYTSGCNGEKLAEPGSDMLPITARIEHQPVHCSCSTVCLARRTSTATSAW